MIIKKIKRRIYKLFHPPIGEVLMLHRVVVDHSVLDDNRLMEITPQFLEDTIQRYMHKGYEFLSLDDLYQKIISGEKWKKKFVCFTFDDGYVDNYEVAYPIFKKYNCPFCIYITTDFPNIKAVLWWYILEDILLKNNLLHLGDGSKYRCDTIELKNSVFRAIREKIFESKSDDTVKTLSTLFPLYSNCFTDFVKKHALSWEQIKLLSSDPLCTIASHSVTHAALDNIAPDRLKFELDNSIEMISRQINKKVIHFSYPYGRCNEAVYNEVLNSEYQTAVLANGGVERKDVDIFKIKRLQLTQIKKSDGK